MELNSGYESPFFITNSDKNVAELKNAKILMYDGHITNMKQIMPVLESVNREGVPLLIMASDIDGEALSTLVVNKMQGKLSICAVKNPEFGEFKTNVMEDLAIVTGGVYVSEDMGMRLEDVNDSHLGFAERLIISKDTTTVIKGGGEKSAISERVNNLKEQLASDSADGNLRSRIAKLVGGVAILNIGAASEVELKEKIDRVDDALAATKAAIEEGYVAGGGSALIRAIESCDNVDTQNEDQDTGVNIVRKSLEEPLRQMVANAGLEPAVIVSSVKGGIEDYGFNVKTEQYGNMYEMGIIDPTKVVRVALENAASVAGSILTTEASIINLKQ